MVIEERIPLKQELKHDYIRFPIIGSLIEKESVSKLELNKPVDTVSHIQYMNFNRQQLNENCHYTPDYTRYCA